MKLILIHCKNFGYTPIVKIADNAPEKSIQNEYMEIELGHHDEKFINDSAFFK